MNWRIYYSDGVFDGDPFAAPGLDVQIIVQDAEGQGTADDVGRTLLYGSFAYWWECGRWWGGDAMGMWDYLQRQRGPAKVIFGRILSTADFNVLMKRALEDPDFRPKTAWLPREQPQQAKSGA